MPREIFILRHCKSDIDNGVAADDARPLSARGIRDANSMGLWMAEHSLRPEVVLCSTAVRARQTLELVNESLRLDTDTIHFHHELYLASRKTLLNFLRGVDLSLHSAMLVGHNPGLDALVEHISIEKLPLTHSGKLMSTGCLAHFDCDDDWRELKHRGILKSMTRPADV